MRSQDNGAECDMTPVPEPRLGMDRVVLDGFEGAHDIDEPYEGMEFESEDAARIYYNEYARHVGFGSRISNNLRSKKDRRTIARKFVCSREGFRAKKHLDNENRVKKPQMVTRVGCGAMMMVKKTELGKWVVSKFVKEHNHPLLSPNEVILLRSHRNPSDTPKSQIKASDGALLDIFGVEAGGIGNIGFIEQDGGNNILTGVKRKRNLGRDTEHVLDYFKRMQSENPAFFYSIREDEGRPLCSLFWANSRSRMACNYFGDVVYFDIMYKMNRYEMSFAQFTGLNHHLQSTVFGCALLLDETESSFIWLFKTWLEAMCDQHGRYPLSIITDENAVIGAAIAHVFPKTNHILNKWHILNRVPKQLSHVYLTFPSFQGEFEKCINLTETIEEFESSWELLLDRYELKDNEWLQLLYNTRKKWVPVFLQGTFFGQMPSSEQSEIVDSFFDDYVNANSTLHEFVAQYERALGTLFEKEQAEDFQMMQSKPELKTRLPIEKHASDVFTRNFFHKLQEEIYEMLGYSVNKVKDDGENTLYSVSKYEDQRKTHTVTFNISERRACCSCQMFEFSGILCRHILKVFTISNVILLPSHYILDRWTRNAKTRVVLDERGTAMSANLRESVTLRYNSLCKQAMRCVEEGATSGESYDVALHALRAAWEKVVASKEKLARVVQPITPVSATSRGDSNISIQTEAARITELETPVSGNSRGDIMSTQCEDDDTTNHISLADPRQWHSWLF